MLEPGPGAGNSLPQTEVGRGSLTKFFKEGLHKAGPRVEVGCVHIQVGHFFRCEDGGDLLTEEGPGLPHPHADIHLPPDGHTLFAEHVHN